MNPPNRLLAWLVTGPAGRLAGFLLELVVAIVRYAIRKPERPTGSPDWKP